MTTLGNPEFIQNAVFLNNSYIILSITFMYRLGNAIGIAACIWYVLQTICDNVNKTILYNKGLIITNAFILFALWVLIDAKINGIELYSVVVHMISCTGYLIIIEKYIKENPKDLLDVLLFILRLLLCINLTLLLLYSHGITTGNDYLHTPYYFLGTKNQITPFLILYTFLVFLNYKRKSKLYKIVDLAIIVSNTFLMGSGTALLCITIIISGSLIKYKSNKHTEMKANSKNKASAGKCLILATVIISIGIVFFNIQNLFGWLIEGILKKDLSLSGRTLTWKLATKQFLSRPLFGYGYGHMVTGHYYAHNAILELLVTTGSIGIILYCRMIYLTFKGQFIKYKNIYTSVIISATVALLVANIGEAFLYNISQLTMFVILANSLVIDNSLEETT